MRPLTWALKEVDLVGLHRQSGIRNRTPSNLKLHHISKNPSQKYFFWQEDGAPLANGALCLKHNGKSGTEGWDSILNRFNPAKCLCHSQLRLGFPTSYVAVCFCVQLVMVRGGFSIC